MIEETWDESDDWLGDEFADGADYGDEEFDDDEDDQTVECPECGAAVYEDAEQCPTCGNYIVHSTSQSDYLWRNRPTWWVILGLLGILAVIVAMAF